MGGSERMNDHEEEKNSVKRREMEKMKWRAQRRWRRRRIFLLTAVVQMYLFVALAMMTATVHNCNFSLLRKSYNCAPATTLNSGPQNKKWSQRLFSVTVVSGRARDDLYGVIDSHCFNPRVLQSKAGRSATARILRRSYDASRR